MLLDYFNSRPSARGDILTKEQNAQIKISIHAPPRGATLEAVFVAIDPLFQFTPLREGRRLNQRISKVPAYFNSRPSARGDAVEMSSIVSDKISIHAPPRGATGKSEKQVKYASISIHAPPRGATLSMYNRCSGRYISIHAPPRGATYIGLNDKDEKRQFQFTPLREGRPTDERRKRPGRPISIHAPPRGATLRQPLVATS